MTPLRATCSLNWSHNRAVTRSVVSCGGWRTGPAFSYSAVDYQQWIHDTITNGKFRLVMEISGSGSGDLKIYPRRAGGGSCAATSAMPLSSSGFG